MEYQPLLKIIFDAYPMYHKIGHAAYKESLENIELLAEITDHPEKKIKTIHIAGTNGKGSVAHILSSYFQEKGLKTGLYTSPHLVDFSERIKINSNTIKEKEVVDFFENYKSEFDKLYPSFFEMTTILAFWYFAINNVDIAIIETGLGGRLDATNIILPIASVITNISKDHTNLLGNTLFEIAKEKAGIIKFNTPVVIGEYNAETAPVFKNIAFKNKAPLYFADREYYAKLDNNSLFVFKNNNKLISINENTMKGQYQLKNIPTAIKTIEVVDTQIDINNIKAALKNIYVNTGLNGRWQIVNKHPLTICDAGHNYDGIKNVFEQLKSMTYNKLHFIFGVVNDKDIDSMLKLFPKDDVCYYLCAASIERALPVTALHDKMRCVSSNIVECENVKEAYQTALKNCVEGDIVFVGGSCFVVGDFLKSLQ